VGLVSRMALRAEGGQVLRPSRTLTPQVRSSLKTAWRTVGSKRIEGSAARCWQRRSVRCLRHSCRGQRLGERLEGGGSQRLLGLPNHRRVGVCRRERRVRPVSTTVPELGPDAFCAEVFCSRRAQMALLESAQGRSRPRWPLKVMVGHRVSTTARPSIYATNGPSS